MQTDMDDPRMKLMKKWSQDLPEYGLNSAALGAPAGRDDEDGDDDRDDTRSVVSRRSVSSVFIGVNGGAINDLHRAKTQLQTGAKQTRGTRKNRRNRRNNRNANHANPQGGHAVNHVHNTNTQGTQGQHQQEQHNNRTRVIYKKKRNKNKVFIENLKHLSHEDLQNRQDELADYTLQFHQGIFNSLVKLATPDSDGEMFKKFVGMMHRYYYSVKSSQVDEYSQMKELYDYIQRCQELLKLQELNIRAREANSQAAKIESLPKRPELYVTLPQELSYDEYYSRVSHEGKDKIVMNLYTNMISVIMHFKRFKTFSKQAADAAAKAKAANKAVTPIPSYKKSQEDEPNFDYFNKALQDIRPMKNLWETYHEQIIKKEKQGTPKHQFHFFTPTKSTGNPSTGVVQVHPRREDLQPQAAPYPRQRSASVSGRPSRAGDPTY